MKIDRLEEHTLRGELAAAIKATLDKATARVSLPELGPAVSAYMADACVAMLLALDDAQEQMRRDGLFAEED